MRYSIDASLLERFPGYRRYLVIANGVVNSESERDLVTALRQQEQALRDSLTLETLADSPNIQAWREAFRAVGLKPTQTRPSIEALARRVLQGNEIPSINTLVDIGTVMSLRYLTPIGVHPLDGLQDDIALRFATGGELFSPPGGGEPETIAPQEVILAAGDAVLTRHWVWRQSADSLTGLDVRNVVFNIDLLPPIPDETGDAIVTDLGRLISSFAGGVISSAQLSAEQRDVSFDLLS